jgi:hypothetical protein
MMISNEKESESESDGDEFFPVDKLKVEHDKIV